MIIGLNKNINLIYCTLQINKICNTKVGITRYATPFMVTILLCSVVM